MVNRVDKSDLSRNAKLDSKRIFITSDWQKFPAKTVKYNRAI